MGARFLLSIKTLAKRLAAILFALGAIAAHAAQIVVTPDSLAGYLYVPANTGAGSGGGDRVVKAEAPRITIKLYILIGKRKK